MSSFGYEAYLAECGRRAQEEALLDQRDEDSEPGRAEREAPDVDLGVRGALGFPVTPRSDFVSLAHEQAEGVIR